MTAHRGVDDLPPIFRDRLRAFGELLRSERVARGLAVRAAGSEAGVNFATFSRAETGANMPDLVSFLALVAWAGVPLSWFDADAGSGLDAWREGFDACSKRVLGALDLGAAS